MSTNFSKQTSLSNIVRYLDALLKPQEFIDSALNGLQIESSNKNISKVVVSVDAGYSSILKALELGAELLIVHHGLFWGEPPALRGALGKKVELLFKGNCSLYASHLPLDSHQEVGNGFELARFLGLTDLAPFCEHKGKTVGAKGRWKSAKTREEVVKLVRPLRPGQEPLILPFGKPTIETVGVVTGSASFALTQCAEEGLDLLLSGEPKHEAFHLAKELEMNGLFAGHYATETFGVKAIASRLETEFGVRTEFVHEESGI